MTDLSFAQIIEESLGEARELDSQRIKDERMKMCMNTVIVSEKENGGRRITYWRCKDSRCPYCREYKGNKFKDRIARVIGSGDTVYITYLFKDAAHKLCRRLHKENYLRLPQPYDMDIVFFISPGVNSKADIFGMKELSEFDWTVACGNDTSTRIISGNLGKEERVPDDRSGFIEITAEDFVVGPVREAVLAVISTSTNVIAWQEPESVEENERFRRHYNAELLKRFHLQGCKLYFSFTRNMMVSDLRVNFFDVDRDEIKEKIT